MATGRAVPLPPSLQAYADGKPPGMLYSQSGHTRQPQPSMPPRSRLLNEMMKQEVPQPTVDTIGKTGTGLWQGYRQMQPVAGSVDNDDRNSAGIASIGSALTGAAGSMLPGWGGKIAQLASMGMGQYSKDRLADSREMDLRAVINEEDATKRNKALMNYILTKQE